MDFTELASRLVESIRPHLGVLLNAGIGAVGKDAWEGVKHIWSILGPTLASDPELRAAAQDVIDEPGDDDDIAALRKSLRKFLERNHEVAESLKPIYQDIRSGGIFTLGFQ